LSVDRGKLVFVLPGLIVLVAIILFPLLFTIRVSLSSWDVAQPGLDWVGVANYLRLAEDTRFWESFARLAVMALGSVALQYLLGFGLALLVWRDVRAGRFFRVLFLIPMMTTPVIMAVIWRTVFHESLGPANDLLHLLGMASLPWLSEAGLAMTSVIIVEVWQWTPFMFLMLLAGLLSLPREPFLAAAIDGAGPIRTFLRVTFPMIAPISIGAIIIRLIEASKIMDTVYVITSGGPGTATTNLTYLIYLRALLEWDVGGASAGGVIAIVLANIVAIFLIRTVARNLDT